MKRQEELILKEIYKGLSKREIVLVKINKKLFINVYNIARINIINTIIKK